MMTTLARIIDFRTLAGLMGSLMQMYSARAQQIRHPALRRAQRVRRLLWACALGLVLSALCAQSVWAAANFTLFDGLDAQAEGLSNSWFSSILSVVRPTFMLLGTIEICWAAAIWAFEKDSLNSLAVEIIKKIMFIGFFFSLLQFAPDWIPRIVDTFQQVGEEAAGAHSLSTDEILSLGLGVIGNIWTNTLASLAPLMLVPADIAGTSNPLAYTAMVFTIAKLILTAIATVVVVIAFTVVAAQYFTLKIESYVLFAAGAIFLGLGSSSWTKEYVSKYLNYAINVGVRLLVLILILSITLRAVGDMGNNFSFDFKPLLAVMGAAVLQAILGMRAPEMAGALLNGGVGLSAGSAKGAASSVAGSARSIAGTVASGVQGMGNLAKAVSAGRDIAKQEGKTGSAATVSGLGKAAAQVGKELPKSLKNAVKDKSGQGKGAGGGSGGPGIFDRAKQSLRAKAAGEEAPKSGAKKDGPASASGGSQVNVFVAQNNSTPLASAAGDSKPGGAAGGGASPARGDSSSSQDTSRDMSPGGLDSQASAAEGSTSSAGNSPGPEGSSDGGGSHAAAAEIQQATDAPARDGAASASNPVSSGGLAGLRKASPPPAAKSSRPGGFT
jgi:type IV secretion system protein TrbL